VFVGYAANGTPARRIIDGARSIRLFDEFVPVRARIHTINGFSAHADRDELLAWHARIGPRRTFLVHGEQATMAAFAASLPAGPIDRPAVGQVFDL
jgi:metallo-beta-lactamase family protein